MSGQGTKSSVYRVRRLSLAVAMLLGASGLAVTLSPTITHAADFSVGDDIVVNTDRLNLRDEVGLDADVVTVLEQGDSGSITAGPENADDLTWYEVEVDGGDTGWVAGDYIDLASDTTFAEGDKVVVVDGNLNLRSEAGMDADIVDVMADGSAATIVSGPTVVDDMDWYEINTVDYGSGWAAGDFLAAADDAPSGDTYPVDTVLYVQTDDGSNLNLREEPTTDAGIVDRLPDGSRVVVVDGPETADGYDWYQVDTDLGTGWAAGEFLVLPADEIEVGDTVRVVDGTLNLRDNAGIDADVLDTLPDGTVLDVTDGPTSADGYTWYEVSNDDFGPGWVAGEFLEIETKAVDDSTTVTPTATATGTATATATATATT